MQHCVFHNQLFKLLLYTKELLNQIQLANVLFGCLQYKYLNSNLFGNMEVRLSAYDTGIISSCFFKACLVQINSEEKKNGR